PHPALDGNRFHSGRIARTVDAVDTHVEERASAHRSDRSPVAFLVVAPETRSGSHLTHRSVGLFPSEADNGLRIGFMLHPVPDGKMNPVASGRIHHRLTLPLIHRHRFFTPDMLAGKPTVPAASAAVPHCRKVFR